MLIISILAGNEMKITILTSKKLKIAIILIFPAKKNTLVRELMTILKFLFTKVILIMILTKVILIMARELNRQLQELQIQLKRNRAKIAEDAQQLEVA